MVTSNQQSLADLRQEYAKGALDLDSVSENPVQQFKEWFQEAYDAQVPEPNAMTLSTADGNGRPSGRVVLLKEVDDGGFVFYTNFQSRKGRELTENPLAALTFLWLELERQVRIEGRVEKVSNEEADAYFDSRPFGSRISAIVSPQSRPIESKQSLLESIQSLEAKYKEKAPPRPNHWGGYRLIPDMIEFWQGRPNRFHDRMLYQKDEDGNWSITRLAP